MWRVLLVGLAVEGALVGPEEVDGGEDHAGGAHHGPPPPGHEAAEKDEELTDEPVEAGHADGAQHHHGEDAGEPGGHLLEAAEGGDLARVAALVEHADQEEEGPGGDPVVDHLQQAALDALRREGEGAEDDEAEVGHRGVGHQPLQVLLHGRHHGAVGDADHPEGHQCGGEPVGRLGEEEDAEAQEAVAAQLQQDAGQDHRAGGGGLGVGVGQPRVHREERHLDGEGHGEAEEQPAGGALGQHVGGVGQGRQVEGEEARLPLHQEDQRQHADEHEDRPGERVEEELQGRVHAAGVAPAPDEEVHRDEGDLEHEEEEEQVEGDEHAHAAGLEEQQPGGVGLGVVVGLDPHERQGEEEPRQEDEEQGDPVHPEVPVDAEGVDPRVAGHELEAVLPALEVDDHEDADDARGHGHGDTHLAGQRLSRPRHQGDEERPHCGQDDEARQHREAGDLVRRLRGEHGAHAALRSLAADRPMRWGENQRSGFSERSERVRAKPSIRTTPSR